MFLGELAVDDEYLECALELGRQLHLHVVHLPVECVRIRLQRLLEVKLALVHQDLESRKLVLAEVHRRLGHVLVNRVREKGHVADGIHTDAIHKTCFLSGAIKYELSGKLLVEL